MIPADLTPRTLRLPPKDICNIVVLTRSELRHERFALRIQQEFGGLVVGSFRITPHARSNRSAGSPTPQQQVEERMFGDEVRQLRRVAAVETTPVRDPNSVEVVESIRSLNPYLLLTLGGPIYRRPLLECVRGLAVNQHAGWSPDYKGSHTVEWAVYHRDLARIGSTVHILTSGLDAGPILRRSTACIVEDDTRESCFARVVALGTELMCEVVGEVLRADEITVYDQPAGSGRTYRGTELTDAIVRDVRSDLERGLIRRELTRIREF